MTKLYEEDTQRFQRHIYLFHTSSLFVRLGRDDGDDIARAHRLRQLLYRCCRLWKLPGSGDSFRAVFVNGLLWSVCRKAYLTSNSPPVEIFPCKTLAFLDCRLIERIDTQQLGDDDGFHFEQHNQFPERIGVQRYVPRAIGPAAAG